MTKCFSTDLVLSFEGKQLYTLIISRASALSQLLDKNLCFCQLENIVHHHKLTSLLYLELCHTLYKLVSRISPFCLERPGNEVVCAIMPAQLLVAQALSDTYFAPRPFLLLFSASLTPKKYHTEDAHVLRGFSERLFF